MRTTLTTFSTLVLLGVWTGSVLAQTAPATPASTLVGKSTNAIGYVAGGGATKVDLKASGAVPQASGEAKVEAKQGVTNIEVKVKGLVQPTKLGPEFLTYVLWAVSTEGRSSNVGELAINDAGEAELKSTTRSQTFSLVVTAEPYFAVRYPSEVVILENALRNDTKGRIFPISEYLLMKRSQYARSGNPLALSLDLKNVPLDVYEARNAVEIARSRGAQKYAPEIFAKAEGGLQITESDLAKKTDRKEIVTRARTTVQHSEDARALAVQRQDEERIAMEREAAAAKARAAAEEKAAAEAKRQAELTAAREAQIKAEADAAKRKANEEAQRQAELTAAREARMKAEAEAAAIKAKSEADALKAKEEAAKAETDRVRQAAETLRAQLLDQLNRILETRDTPRGLVVSMADVLFDTGKFELRQTTREKLARLSGIILAHPGLKLEIEGHTDSTGGTDLNQTLSEQRASEVSRYLVEQGLSADSVTAKGFGETMPVADNSTNAGRQKNRRVEIIVSGESIGIKMGK